MNILHLDQIYLTSSIHGLYKLVTLYVHTVIRLSSPPMWSKYKIHYDQWKCNTFKWAAVHSFKSY